MFAQHPYAAWPWAGGAWALTPPGPTLVVWPDKWCPALAPSRTDTLEVDVVEMGDGYCHRSTHGYNPVKTAWAYQFPFTALDTLEEMDAFLQRYGAPGFWFLPPEQLDAVMIVCNEWSASITERSGKGAMIGFLQATFMRIFNPQPLTSIAGVGALRR